MNIEAIIFDLDGTLLDTLEDIGDAVNRVLSERGFPSHGIDAYRYFIGDGSEMLIKRALPENRRSDHAVEQALAAFKRDYGRNWDQKTRPYEGIPELLDELIKKGIGLGVCSNKPHAFSALCVGKLLKRWRFDPVLGQSTRHPKKPAPDMALAIAHRMGINPAQMMFVGDSGVDMRTAAAAGMVPVGAAWGFRTAKELTANGCRYTAYHPMDVLNAIADMNTSSLDIEYL